MDSEDYLDKLIELSKSDNQKQAKEALEAIEFLAKFNDEFYCARIYKGDVTALHSTEELRKSCYSNNNRLRRDIMNNFKKVS